MVWKVSDVLTRVRETVQDATGTRYSDESLFGFINEAVEEARSLRPDLFVYAFDDDLATVDDGDDDFPLPSQFFTATCHYVAGRAELRDDEFAVDGRAAMLMGQLKAKLIQGM